jgi:hypothetical protein
VVETASGLLRVGAATNGSPPDIRRRDPPDDASDVFRDEKSAGLSNHASTQPRMRSCRWWSFRRCQIANLRVEARVAALRDSLSPPSKGETSRIVIPVYGP